MPDVDMMSVNPNRQGLGVRGGYQGKAAGN